MTLREIIAQLEKEGHAVKYYNRYDGSVVITKIDGVRYSGKTGNKAARDLTGASLSSARAEQLHMIQEQRVETEEGPAKLSKLPPSKRKLAPISTEMEKLLKATQKEWRKLKKTSKTFEKSTQTSQGKITKKRLRDVIRYEGEEMARQHLIRNYLYAQHLATYDTLQVLLQELNRLETAAATSGNDITAKLHTIENYINEQLNAAASVQIDDSGNISTAVKIKQKNAEMAIQIAYDNNKSLEERLQEIAQVLQISL